MTLAREQDVHAFHVLFAVGRRGGMVGVEHDCHVRTNDHAEHGQPLDQLVARRFKGRIAHEPFELRPRVDHVVPVDDDSFH